MRKRGCRLRLFTWRHEQLRLRGALESCGTAWIAIYIYEPEPRDASNLRSTPGPFGEYHRLIHASNDVV